MQNLRNPKSFWGPFYGTSPLSLIASSTIGQVVPLSLLWSFLESAGRFVFARPDRTPYESLLLSMLFVMDPRDASLHGSRRSLLCLRMELFFLLWPGTHTLGGTECSLLKVGERLLFELLYTCLMVPRYPCFAQNPQESLKEIPHLL